MPGQGPLPKDSSQRRRRNADGLSGSAQRLPASGREGEPPPWPLPAPSGSAQAQRELEQWARLWRTPQAVAWELIGCVDVVARYARLLVEAERVSAKAAILGEVRQLEDRLGLTPVAMARLRWTIADQGPAEVIAITSLRDRMDAVGD